MARLAIQKLPESRFHMKYRISYWDKARVIKNWVAIQTCRQTGVCLCTLAFTFQVLLEINHTNVYIFSSYLALNAFRLIWNCRPQLYCCVMLLFICYTQENWVFSINYRVPVLWLYSNCWSRKAAFSGICCVEETVACSWWVLGCEDVDKKIENIWVLMKLLCSY